MIARNLFPFEMDIIFPENQTVPFWTGFNSSLSKKNNVVTIVSYAPIIEAKPADMTTVYSTMIKCRDMTKQFGQSHAIQTMDQQLYGIAQEVKWSKADELGDTLLRLGGFHAICIFIAAIVKIWGDGLHLFCCNVY